MSILYMPFHLHYDIFFPAVVKQTGPAPVKSKLTSLSMKKIVHGVIHAKGGKVKVAVNGHVECVQGHHHWWSLYSTACGTGASFCVFCWQHTFQIH